ncbi:DUF397 domain-containing protein [Streptomyces angustmyceticus]|uniref:DUF397 domain-containing protein n=1 Tax=Streptomyces angustmyceticus TaxID=285578 RepID=UPI001CBF6CD6|nr:DUF397 domain-containing protein [Streptomyces angustmyceticus]
MDKHWLSTAIWTKSSYSDRDGGNCIEVSLTWMKSSYSDNNGGNCLEASLPWTKSSHSHDDGGDCIEIAPGIPDVVPVRDSKDPHGPVLVFPTGGWSSFVAALKDGEFPAAI